MRWILSTLTAAAIATATFAGSTEDELKRDLRKLDLKYVTIKLKLLKAYKAKFELLTEMATKKGDLDEAIRLRNIARDLDAQIKAASFTSPMPTPAKPMQTKNDTKAKSKFGGYTSCQVGAIKVASSSPSFPHEQATKAFDGTSAKWNSKLSKAFVVFSFTTRPQKIAAYAIESANAAHQRDPKDWCFYGSYDGRTWTLLDKQTGIAFPSRNASKVFKLKRGVVYKHFKFEVLANHGDGNTQLAELHLLRR